MANKSPACRFYFADFDMDTAHLTNEEIGAYMRLLTYQWINGFVPFDEKKRARIARCTTHKMKKLWAEIGGFFVQHGERFLNPRMEEERQKQAEYTAKKVEAGRKGGLASAASKEASSASSTAAPELQAESNLPFSSSGSKERETNTDPLSQQPATTREPAESKVAW